MSAYREQKVDRLIFTDTGFIAVKDDPAGYTYPNFTLSGRRYDYIAFR